MQIHSKTLGQGPPLIILHGLFGMSDNWVSFAKALAKDYTVILLDLRNHGRSFHTGQMDFSSLSQDILDWMNDNWVIQSNIMGHSLGGKVAMQIANEHSDSINKLIVLDIAPKAYSPRHLHILKAISNIDMVNARKRADLKVMFDQQGIEEYISAFLLKNVKRNEDGKFEWKFNFEAIQKNYHQLMNELILGQVDVPTLFVRGGQSSYILPEDEPVIQTRFTNVHFQTIARAGHWVHADAREELVEIVRRFLG